MALKIDTLEVEIKSQADSASASVRKLTDELKELRKQSKGIDQVAKSLKKVAETTSSKKTKETSAFGVFGKLMMGKGGGFLRSIGRIAMYRGIRSGMKAIASAMKEGTSNLYQFSKMTNGTFAKSMDSLSTSVLYLKNGLAVGLAPIIEWLIPKITALADAVAELGNALSEISANENGDSTFQRAKKKWTEYAKAINEAKGALLGFDELNVIQKSEDDSENFAEMFETAVVDSERAEANSWGIAGALSAIAGVGVGSGALKAILALSQAGVLETTLAGIAAIVAPVAAIGAAVALIAVKGKEIAGWLRKANEWIDGIHKKILDFLDPNGDNPFGTVLAKNPVFSFIIEELATISDMIYDLFHLDFQGFAENFVNWFLNIGNLWVDIVWGLVYVFRKAAQDVTNIAIDAINGVINGLDTALSKVGIHWLEGVSLDNVDFTSTYERPHFTFDFDNGFQTTWETYNSRGNNTGRQTGDTLINGSMNGVEGELGFNYNDVYAYGPQQGSSEPFQINLYLDGQQILNSVYKAERLTGVAVAKGIVYR